MKKISILIFVLISNIVHSQTTYIVNQVQYNPDPFTSGTSILLADDQYSPVIPIPFSFCYFDSSYAKLVIASNGYITFDTTLASGYSPWPIANPIPSPINPTNAIMCPWQDIDPSMSGTITYAVHGIAPYRRFVVSYYMIPMFSCTGMLFTEQVILYETTNIIETYILDKPNCLSWNNGLAVHGIQNINGTVGYAVPGRNATAFSCQFDGWRFSPIGGCAGVGPSCLITGKDFNDYNNDCVMNGNDSPNVNRSILVNGGDYYAWTDTAGNYSISVDTGVWQVNEQTPLYYQTACPSSGSYNLNLISFGTTSLNNDFGDSVLVYCPDLRVDIGTANMTRCLTENVGVFYANQGTVIDSSVVVNVTLNDSLQILNSNTVYTPIGNNQYSFNVGNLLPGTYGIIHFTMSVGCDTVGTVYCMNATINGNSVSDCDTSNNHSIDCHALITSIDPNEKKVAAQNFSQMGYVTDDVIDNNDELTYLIAFQNTGSDTAVNIIVRDTISPYLDVNSIVPGAASDNYTWTVANGVLIFNFHNIMLVDSNTNEPMSHAFIKYTIHQQNGNVAGTTIHNQAAIYFDFNQPIFTNTTTNLIPLETGSALNSLSDDFGIYPNPSDGNFIIFFNGLNELTSFNLYNPIGQKEYSTILKKSDHIHSVESSSLPSGIYFYQFVSDGIILKSGKLIVKQSL